MRLRNHILIYKGEDPWRYGEIKGIAEFAERYIPKNLGSKYMIIIRWKNEQKRGHMTAFLLTVDEIWI